MTYTTSSHPDEILGWGDETCEREVPTQETPRETVDSDHGTAASNVQVGAPCYIYISASPLPCTSEAAIASIYWSAVTGRRPLLEPWPLSLFPVIYRRRPPLGRELQAYQEWRTNHGPGLGGYVSTSTIKDKPLPRPTWC